MYSLVDLWTLTYSVIQFIIYKIKDILGTSIKLVYEKQNLSFSCFFYYVLNQWIFTSFFLYCCWIIPKVIYPTQFFVCDGTFQVALKVDFKCFNWHVYESCVRPDCKSAIHIRQSQLFVPFKQSSAEKKTTPRMYDIDVHDPLLLSLNLI